jgi:diguanylate cyclase (GGDEF)-like protein
MQKSRSEMRLIASIGLLLIPIAVLGWFFVAQSNKDITFGSKEIDGVTYLRAVMPIYEAVATGQPIVPAETIEALQLARTRYDREMETAEISGQLDSLLAMSGIQPGSILSVTSSLVSKIGDNSNLILDPDLDTYYLMDLAVLELPQILAQTDRMQVVLEESHQKPSDWNGHAQLHGLISQLRNQHDRLGDSLRKVFEHSSDPALPSRLQAATAPIFGELTNNTFEIATSAQRKTAPPKPFGTYRNDFAKSHFALWKLASDELEMLLNKRVQSLRQKLYAAIGASALVTVLALLLAFSVLRRLLSKLDEHIVFLAHHDPMTRLKNRASFSTEMEQALVRAKDTGEMLALHVIDCDSFKSINDTYGHPAGDAVLRHVSETLLKHTRPNDIVGRLGGDEFVVLQQNLTKPEDAAIAAMRIVEAMREPLAFEAHKIKTSVSIGNAVYPSHASISKDLMQFADASLFAAKQAGRNRAVTFSQELEAEMAKQRELEQDVTKALDDDRFFLNFQPKFSASGQKLVGFEALLRMRNSANVTIPPGVFIPVAERLNLISKIGEWVLRKATQTASLWPDELTLAVNLSPLQFKSGTIATIIEQALNESGLQARRLEIEITENILLEDAQHIHRQLEKIRELGVSIVMDDFGTGFSSLSYLWRFRFDKIKIDRSFMQALDNDAESAGNILRSIVTLGHSLDMKVVAEGVETDNQAQFVNTIKCDEVQGFLFGRPMLEQDVASLILNKFREHLPQDVQLRDEAKTA